MVGCGRRAELMIGLVVVVVVGAWGAVVGSTVRCNNDEYPHDWIGAGQVVNDLAANTGGRSPQDYSTNYPVGNPYVWGHATCAQLSELDCFNCLTNVAVDLEEQCPYRKGAMEDVDRCMIRYEFYAI